jgi:hypothetical protein
MFCPKCSQAQASDNLRFCSRCGFRLDEVKELVLHEESHPTDESESRDASTLPRQRDISLGAGLMFIGGFVAVWWGYILGRGGPDVVLPQAFAILGFTLCFVLLLFRPLLSNLHKLVYGGEEHSNDSSKQRDGINLGAVLMFAGTLKAMLLTTFLHPNPRGPMTLLIMFGVFLLLLVLRWLMQTFYQLFSKGTARAETASSAKMTSDLTLSLDSPAREAALPPAQEGIPINGFASSRVNTAEVIKPPSVTEQTTRRLEK